MRFRRWQEQNSVSLLGGEENNAEESVQIIVGRVGDALGPVLRVLLPTGLGDGRGGHGVDGIEDPLVPGGSSEEGGHVEVGDSVHCPASEGPDNEHLHVVGPAGGNGQTEKSEGDKQEEVP